MQKQKISSSFYLALQNTYEDISVAIFNENKLLDKAIINKKDASKDLVLTLDSLLKKNNLSVNDLNFIGINQGPGPFTTLRVVITIANALNFASNIPLIGIDGLEALIFENYNSNWPITIGILNAYNNDTYFIISENNKIIDKNYNNIDNLLEKLKLRFINKNIRFIGNGTKLFEQNIKKVFPDSFLDQSIDTCSINQIGIMSYENWLNKTNLTDQIKPLYLKSAISIN